MDARGGGDFVERDPAAFGELLFGDQLLQSKSHHVAYRP